MLRRKFIALSVKFRRENRSKINNLIYYFKKLEKISKKTEKEIVRAKIISMNLIARKREEINKEKKTVSWKKWIRIDKLPASLTNIKWEKDTNHWYQN